VLLSSWPSSRRTSILATEGNVAAPNQHPQFIISPSSSHEKKEQPQQHAKQKPYFVIHAGAHKTATTTVQTALGQYFKDGVLQQDNYVYLGKFLNPASGHRAERQSAAYTALFGDPTCPGAVQAYYYSSQKQQQQPVSSRLNNKNDSTAAVQTTTTTSPPPSCWEDLLAELDQHEGRNLIVSEEGFGTLWLDKDLWDPKNDGNAANQYSVMRNLERALDGRWEIVVVVAYRRLYEWLPSAKQQLERWHEIKKNLNQWPGKQGGKVLKPLFPDYALHHPYVDPQSRRPKGYRYTSDIVDYFHQHYNNDNTVTTRILNFHSPAGVNTELFCRMIPHAPTACATAQRQADPVVNARQSDQAYDRLVTTASQHYGWIDTARYARHDVAVAAQRYHEQRDPGTTVAHLARTCPSRDQLQILLDASLRMEARILFPEPPQGVMEQQRRQKQEQEHRDAFWEAAALHKFCSVDPQAELQKEHWRDFFAAYAPQPQR